MNINARFEEIINSLYKGNKRAFAQSVGISATVVENVVGTRKGKPSYDVLEKVCANANISAEWLLTGKGEMQRAEDRHSRHQGAVLPPYRSHDWNAERPAV